MRRMTCARAGLGTARELMPACQVVPDIARVLSRESMTNSGRPGPPPSRCSAYPYALVPKRIEQAAPMTSHLSSKRTRRQTCRR